MELASLINGRLIIETGDITNKKVGAIVNAANSSLMGGGGVDGAIHRAGGHVILEECKKIRESVYPDGLPAGKAVSTGAGNMPAKYVIHTVGPVWYGGEKGEPELLSNAYENSLIVAKELGVKEIAFPAVSTGVYGFPKDKAAEIVYKTIDEYLYKNKIPKIVYLVFFSNADADIFLKSIQDT